MSAVIFIGDEITAAGYRLAGVHVLVPASEASAISSAFEEARSQGDLVLITQEYANKLPPPLLNVALSATAPALAVVADARNRVPLVDIGSRLRRQLGVEE